MEPNVQKSESVKKLHRIEEADVCLVCNDKVSHVKVEEKRLTMLSGSIDTFFLFKELLKVPDSDLVKNFKHGDPCSWISLCEDCTELTQEAIELHFRIQKLEKNKWDIRENLVRKIKSSSSVIPIDVNEWINTKKIEVLKRTRKFVEKCTYGRILEDQVLSNRNGDQLAKNIAEKQISGLCDMPQINNKLVIRIKVEHADDLVTEENVGINGEKEKDESQLPECSMTKTVKKNRRLQKTSTKASANTTLTDTNIDDQSKKKANGKWKCRLCSEVFGKPAERMVHEKENHGSPTGVFQCNICGTGRESLYNLLQHKRRVHKLRPDGTPIIVVAPPSKAKKTLHKCKICNATVACLTNHVRLVHEKKYSNFCELCGTGFWGTDAYKIHLLRKHKEDSASKKMIEEGVSILKCSISGCKAYFLKKDALERHEKKLHDTGNKARFTCAECGKGFLYQIQLNNHEKLHSLDGTKPFSCDICKSSFTTSKYLKDHIRRIHKS